MPTVKAGNRICQPITQANCRRDSRTGSRSMVDLLLPSATRPTNALHPRAQSYSDSKSAARKFCRLGSRFSPGTFFFYLKFMETTAPFVAGVPVGDPNVPLDNTDSCRDLHRARDQRLTAGRVLIGPSDGGLASDSRPGFRPVNVANGMVRPCSGPASKRSWQGVPKKARHVTQAQCWNRRDRYRYRQELVSRRGSRSAWRDRPAPEVVSRPSGNTTRQPTALSHRHGGLRRRTQSEPQTHIAWPRRSADASQICAALLEGAEERLPRRGGDRGGGAAPDDEVRRNQDRRAARLAGAPPRA